MKYERLIHYFLLFGIIAIYVCCNSNEKSSHKNDAEIVKIAEEDSKDGIANPSDIKIDKTNLPNKKYLSDKDHSSISFRTKHWEIVDLMGWFADFDVVMYSDESDFSDAVISARVYPKSLHMPNIKMQGSAQNDPYIDSKKHPVMTFQSKEMKPIGDDRYDLSGIIQINGIEKEMVFDVIFNGFAYPGEQSICGFDVRGKINRNDFNIAGDAKLHSGKVIHNDTISIQMALRME